MAQRKTDKKPQNVRCAIYTRKSTEESLEQEFNSLDAQRESAEAFIKSQAHEGWVCLPDYYDDGGFTGGNADRPAVQRLLNDIEAGKIDCVVVYKVDRLSRSLLDFARLMETFEKHDVSFVSVTQQFNTCHSMGRLTLNILFSFAQFEREIISERTRDKIAAARRKGKWSGGMPVLGYGVDPVTRKLVVDETESARVREIYQLYLERGSMIPTVRELERRGWLSKRWETKKGTIRGGKPFNKGTLHNLLTSVTYLGKLRYKDEIHEGEHDAIVSEELFQQVQSVLARNRVAGGAEIRNRHGAMLKGILRCSACGCAMSYTYTQKKNRKYRYYRCIEAAKRGAGRCPSKSVPAEQIERFVVEQIRCIGRDRTLATETIRQANAQVADEIAELKSQRSSIRRDLKALHDEIRRLSANPDRGDVAGRLADIHDQISNIEGRDAELREKIEDLESQVRDATEATVALAAFDPIWESLSPKQQARVVQLLIERIEYNGGEGSISITFQPTGIKTLAEELNLNSDSKEETAA